MDFADGKNQLGPWEKLKNQIFLGSDNFVTSLQRTLDPDVSHQEISAALRRPPAKPLAQIDEAHGRDEASNDGQETRLDLMTRKKNIRAG